MVLSPRQMKAIEARDNMETGGRTAPLVPKSFLEAQAFCGALAQSDLIPQKLKERAADVLVLVLAGMEIGLTPMASIRMHHVIEGLPRLSADGLAAIVMQSSECEYLECSTSTDTACTWITKRRGRPEKSATWNIERAKRAGLTEKRNRDGSPGMWMKYPENMLSSRAKAELCRMVYPDICAGLRSAEEAVDRDFIEAEFTEPAPTKPIEYIAPPVKAQPVGPPPGVPQNPPEAASSSSPASSASTSSAAAGSNSKAARAASSRGKAAESGPTPPPSSSDGASDSGGRISSISAPPSTASTEPEQVAEKKPEPPIEASAAQPEVAADFGDDPPDAPPEPPKETLADFVAWLQSCKSQADLQKGLPTWKTWSHDRAKSGDNTFNKDGKNAIAMAKAYADRKAEVPA